MERGKVTVKGKGEMVTFWVEGKANRAPPLEDDLKALVEAMAAKKKAEATGQAELAIYLEKRKTTTPETVSFAYFMFSDETNLEKDLFWISYTEQRLSLQQIKSQAKVFAWVLDLSMNL